MATQRQIDSNKRNAQASTGPKTAEGKAISRGNAAKHGLSGDGTSSLPEELQELEARLESWRPSFQHQLAEAGPDRELLFREMVLNSLRMERAQRREMDLHQDVKNRAAVSWESDRQLLAESIGSKLATSKCPGLVVARLKTFLQGLEWLQTQWLCLKTLFESGREVPETRKALYFGLIGMAPDLRTEGAKFDSAAALVRAEHCLACLEGEALEDASFLDAHDRDAAVQRGFTVEISKDERLNRRYEDLAHRRYHSARSELKKDAKPVRAQASPAPRPSQVAPPKPPVAVSRAVSKPLDDFGSIVDEVFASKPTPARNEPNATFGKMQPTLTPRNPSQIRITPARA